MWIAKIDGSDKPEQLIHARGDEESLRWSPDGSKLAFESHRDEHDLIVVYDFASKTLRYIDPSVDRDSDAVWSPDGKQIAFLRIPASREAFMFGPKRSAQPWSVRVADVASGTGRQVFIADEGRGSNFHQAVAENQILWAAGDQLVFPWEKNGWLHLYAVPAQGGKAKLLTPGDYHNAYAMNQYLASRGYIVLAVNYRSGIGYGMEFREALNYGATGASEFNDVLGAGLFLKGRPDVDAQYIGLWGGSYGGYLTALGLARASDLFAAGVDMHGVHDWNLVIRNFVPAYDPEAQRDAARLAFNSSPLASMKTWRSPVLLIQGDDDRNVPFTETIHLAEALRKQGVEFEQLVFPDEVHDFLTHQRWLEAYHATADFLDRHLKSKN